MDKFLSVKQKYDEILELQQTQLEVELDVESEDCLDKIKVIEDRINTIVASIKQAEQDDTSPYSETQSALLEEQIAIMLERNSELVKRLEYMYSKASISMKQVSRHRKTLNSYGGVQQYDEIAYYFDEKR